MLAIACFFDESRHKTMNCNLGNCVNTHVTWRHLQQIRLVVRLTNVKFVLIVSISIVKKVKNVKIRDCLNPLNGIFSHGKETWLFYYHYYESRFFASLILMSLEYVSAPNAMGLKKLLSFSKKLTEFHQIKLFREKFSNRQIYPNQTTIIIGDVGNTESDTLCL